jgi:hypothetical protein
MRVIPRDIDRALAVLKTLDPDLATQVQDGKLTVGQARSRLRGREKLQELKRRAEEARAKHPGVFVKVWWRDAWHYIGFGGCPEVYADQAEQEGYRAAIQAEIDAQAQNGTQETATDGGTA